MRRGLARIRSEFEVPDAFPADVLAAANATAARRPTAEHVDRTDVPFVTLDPAASTDLDQAFALERAGSDIVLRYAIADVGHFVSAGDPVDREAWTRGVTLYLPDGRAGLHPPVLAEGAASLLPDGDRPATIFVVRLDEHGVARLDAVERAVVRSRAKLAYDAVTPADVPPELEEFARRMRAADEARGATRIEAPEQVVEKTDEGYRLEFRPRLWSEEWNSAMSLATNLAVADALLAARTGLFRVMAEPDERAIHRLRHTARALGLEWPTTSTLAQFETTLRPDDPKHASFVLAIRRAGGGASYVGYRDGEVPWHSAMAATYAHVTAPLRRLADRFAIDAVRATSRGEAVPEHVEAAFVELPPVMERAESKAGRLERAVIDLVEAALLEHRVGSTHAAVVTDTDERGARIQLCDVAVVARVTGVHVEPGDHIRVKVTEADPERGVVTFTRVA
jgi:exoribonuclease R